MSIFTAFSKAVKSHIGLSFARSARDNCETSCRLWDSCYAARIERIYTGLNSKLAKHYKNGPLYVVNQAIAQFNGKPTTWARISIDGSLPRLTDLDHRTRKAFVKRLRVFVQMLLDAGACWHIPVESMAKARSYRAALRGLGVIVRRTSQAKTIGELLQSKDHCAWVVAKRIHKGHVSKDEKQANIELAKQHAATIRAAGKSVVVCPAILGSSKCGQCKACASPRVDVVLYPFHP